ncbi:MAG: riboflavin synthase, partial [Adlercreutzia sp.]|nr:riboflavin synthase [Adlercreutzia sp.]
MFTGIVEEVGRVRFLRGGSKDGVLRIAAKRVLGDVRLGDSIAVNGVCLTVTDFDGGSFTADVMPETLRRSNLGMLRAGSPVNLERALVADGRFGGHIVSGHIDGMGTIASVRQEANAVWYEIEAAPSLLRLVVEKGSVALDGISLTVA